MPARPRILLLPGDGIGPEVVEAAVAVLEAAGLEAEFLTRRVGAGLYAERGVAHDDDVFELATSCDAVLLGAVGDPRLPQAERAAVDVLLALRKRLGVFANLRPVRTHPALAPLSPLRPEILRGVDLVIVRELTGGLYFGEKGRTPHGAFDTMPYSEEEVRRIVRFALDLARSRRGRLASVDKANVLETSRLWREVVQELASGYPDVAVEHLYVDNAAMQLLLRPASFDVLVTENLFGDILSDEAAVLAGSLGMLPSASVGGVGGGLYEPVHGSAPDLAGRGTANPAGAILSAALLLRHALGDQERAGAVERAVEAALARGVRTPDLGGEAGTADFTKAVIEAL